MFRGPWLQGCHLDEFPKKPPSPQSSAYLNLEPLDPQHPHTIRRKTLYDPMTVTPQHLDPQNPKIAMTLCPPVLLRSPICLLATYRARNPKTPHPHTPEL